MDNKLTVAGAPHIAAPRTTRGIMLDVIIALLFPAVASVLIFGYRAAVLIAVCVAGCVAFEWAWCRIVKKPVMAGDLSAVVTGMLLAFNLPAGLPIWQAVIGCLVAIVVVKQLFGGLGRNFMNPALTARVALALSFAGAMTTYALPGGVDLVTSATVSSIDALTSATPLHLIAQGHADKIDVLRLILGAHGGVLGETSALALVLGGLYLVIRRVITPILPLSYIGAVFIFSWLFGAPAPLLALLSGGLLLGAIFMATDYTTAPYTGTGKLAYGLLLGLLTAFLRRYANADEGVSYAILLGSLTVSYINDLTRRTPLGAAKKSKRSKNTRMAEQAAAQKAVAADRPARIKFSLKPVLALALICVVMSGAVVAVHTVISPIIQQKADETLTARLRAVLPDATAFDELETDVDDVVHLYRDRGGNGYVVVSTAAGYGGEITVTTGIASDGTLLAVVIDAPGETPNIGSRVTQPEFTERFVGIAGDTATVDTLSGATVSSRAVKNAVDAALLAAAGVKEAGA